MTQQFQETTENNFIETLEYNRFKKNHEGDYIRNDDDAINYFIRILPYLSSSRDVRRNNGSPMFYDYTLICCASVKISTPNFNEFLPFLQRRILLELLPVNETFRPHWNLYKLYDPFTCQYEIINDKCMPTWG